MSDPITRLNAALEGRYRIESELGEGGMATVYLADDIKHERKIALKVLKPELAAVVGAERFLAEIKTTANLQHPHILPLFDSGEADSFLFYVMPYVEGETLRERIEREKQLPVDDAVQIATAVANALQHAHERGVIHRDIKPANILIQDGEPVVADFGIALAVGSAGGARLTETGLSVGTPWYMSPEQATGDQKIGPPTDTYALGAVLYEMLIGDPPYMGSTAQAVLGQIIAGESVSATKKRPSVPANVDAALRRALEKLPADRFASAQEFAKALADPGFRHGEPVATATGGDASRGWLWGVAGVTIGIAAGIYFGSADRSSEGLGPVHFAFPVAETAELWSTRNNAAVAISRDGSTIGYAATTAYGGGQFVRSLSGLEIRSFVSGQWTYGPFFDSAGERMAYVVDGRRLEAVGTDGAGRVTLATFQTNAHSGRWGPDGSIVVSLGGHGLVRVSPGSANQDTLTRPDSAEGEVAHEWPEFLPGGESLLFTIRYDDGSDSIAVLSVPDRKIRRGIIEGAHGKYVRTGHLVFARDDGILVAPFDAEGASVTGPLVRMVENVASRGAAFDIAETGTLVYEPRSAPVRGLLWVDEGGGATTIPVEPAEYFGPRLSPDRRRVGVSIGVQVHDIWSIDASSGAARQMAFTGNSTSPTWSPDGSYVYYKVEGSGVIHRIDADGSNRVEINYGLGRLDAHPVDISPDGAWLALDWWDDAGPGASALNLKTGEVVPISDPNEGTGQEIVFSPDGALVAYTNVATDGTYRVVVRTFPDTRAGRWNVGEQGASSPLWAPDGSRIFVRYRTRLAQIPIALTPTFDFGPSSDLFDGPYMWSILETAYDYDPVGRRFLMVESSAPYQIMVVLNWFEELRQRMGN